MPELHLSLAVSPILLLLLGITAVLLTIWSYRTTIPPISPGLRRLLLVLRSVLFLLVIFLIGEPVLGIRRTIELQPRVLVLADNSLSMTLRDGTGNREKIARNVIDHEAFSTLSANGQLRTMRFDRDAISLERLSGDSMTFAGAVTDLSAALRKAKEAAATAHIRAVVLITDGNATVGPTPLYDADELGLPVFTIGVGDTADQKDLQIRNILTNETVYAGTRVPFRVNVRSAGYDGEEVAITLRAKDSIVAQEKLVLQSGIRDYEVTLSATPTAEGRETYRAELSILPNELTAANNRASVTIRVLRSKMQVLLLAGGPSPDVAFIRRVLAADKNIELHAYTENAAGVFLEGDPSRRQGEANDAVVLVGYPRASSDRRTISWVREEAERGAGLFFVLGRTVDIGALGLLMSVLPVTLQDVRTEELQVFAAVPDAKAGHELLKTGTGATSTEDWKRLAPAFRWQSGFSAKPESDVLALVRVGNTTFNEPMIVSRNVNRRRSLAIAAYGIWRWQMLADAGTGAREVFPSFIERSIRWLTTKEDERRVRVQPERDLFTSAEPVTMEAQVYDEAYRPIEGATVRVQVNGGGTSRDIECVDQGNGQYAGVIEPLPEGDYAFYARATSSQLVLGEDRGTFRVGAVTVEFLETKMNKPLLQQLAKRTGGRYFDADRLDDLYDALRSSPGFTTRESDLSSEIELWNREWMLIALIGLVATEWVIRKRKGML